MVEHLNDIAGIRIICSFMSDIYPIVDMIVRQADITVLHVKDYIKYPKANGYKSYHMVVTIPVHLSEGKRYEGRDPDPHHRDGLLGVPGTQDRL